MFSQFDLVRPIDIEPRVAFHCGHQPVILSIAEQDIIGAALLVEVVPWEPLLRDILRANKPVATVFPVCDEQGRMNITLDETVGHRSQTDIETGCQFSHGLHVEAIEVTHRVLEHEIWHQQFCGKAVRGRFS